MAHAPVRWDYPPIEGIEPDVLLVSHEHPDHNGVGAIEGTPHLVRSLAGTFKTPAGPIVGVAGEHDDVAGTSRGHVVMFVLELDGVRLAHLSDLGQPALRPEQVEAIGKPDVLFVPVGGGPTLGAIEAEAVCRQLDPTWVVPMHYRSPLIDFLEPIDETLSLFGEVEMLKSPAFEMSELRREAEEPVLVVPDIPRVSDRRAESG
jgi:L-ascorbate metabolism protein UlaG (beta-lactamase superfamily)